MSDGSIPARIRHDAARARPVGRVRVGNYVGQPAGEAARSLRRAGLKPGLDRSFGCEPGLMGLVVAQEPAAEQELARAGIVTLYVAAPDPQLTHTRDQEGASTDQQPQDGSIGPEITPTAARPRARRKPGLGRDALRAGLDPAPDPSVGVDRAWETERAEVTAAYDEQQRPETTKPSSVPESADCSGCHETLVREADELFAARAAEAPTRRRPYLRAGAQRRWQRTIGWSLRHRTLAVSLCVVLTAWVAVALSGSLGRSTAEISPGLGRPSASHPLQSTGSRRRPVLSQRLTTERQAPEDRYTAAHGSKARSVARPGPAPQAGARHSTQSVPATPVPERPPPWRAPAQSGGGPFSP